MSFPIVAVIMAGGRGTRIASYNSEVPKPMIPVAGKPVLEYEIDCLRNQGCREIILVIGFLGKKIRDYFGDGDRFGVRITYIVEEEPLGTAGALFYLKDKINDDFLLLCGDLIFDIDLQRFYRYHRERGALATLFTHPNSHPYDSGIVIADENGRVSNWLHKEDARLWYRNRVNAGLHMLSPRILDSFTAAEKKDLDRDILKPLIRTGNLYAYDSPEYVKDMGTPDRLHAVEADLSKGLPHAKNLSGMQRAIFLDRDGTINEYVGFLTDISQFRLKNGVAEAIRKINESGYLAIVVTNQPVIARGEVSTEALREIHNKMETLLGQEGAFLDAIYYCPHHPHKGYPGERAEYKIDCACRKPKAGMLLKAAEDFHIALQDSWMVGDGDSDVECGINGGCKTAIIGNNPKADYCGKDLADCIEYILRTTFK